MLKINKQTITLTKGDDASLRLVPRYKDRTEYVLTEGDSAVFRIKFGHTLVELDCTLNLETNKIVANITPNDTKDFNPGIYRYEAELITSFGFHYTFIADQTFILGQEYEQRITSTSNGNSSAVGGNLPEIDGVVDGEPVVYGDIQPTNPMMDYEELNHLPKLNGVTIKGDKDNEYYGIPTTTSDLENDSDFVSDDDYVHTDNNYDDTAKDKVDALGTASTKNIPESGNASPTEVVMGSDTRLSDSRPASDVYDWAKASAKPSYSYSEISNTPTLGTAAAKNFTNTVTSDSTDLVESGAVKTAIDSALSSAYKHGGTKTVEELTSALLIEANQGYVYNITSDGVTTADFIEGAGKPIRAGDNVGIAKVNNTYKFDLLSGFIDTSNFVEKSLTSGLIKNDGTIDTTAYAKQNEMSVSASGDQTTIQLKSGTSATVLNAHQDISGKANKSEMFITDGTGADADKTTIQLKDGLSKAVLIAHQDISGKVDKEQGKGLSTEDYTTTEKTKLGAISDEANEVTTSSTNGHINIDGVDATVYDDSAVTSAISAMGDDIEDIQDELSTGTDTVEGNPINFTTLSSQNAESTIIDLEPIQDLHGYDKPWAGGVGKNILPMTVALIKALNTDGIWTGNSYVDNNVTFTIITDSDNNVVGIKVNGMPNARTLFVTALYFTDFLTNGVSYTINGNASGYSTDTAFLQVVKAPASGQYNIDDSYTFTYDSATQSNFKLCIRVDSGKQANNLIFYPMIRLSTETDPTFAPYTNICPITGRTEIGILGCGKNLCPYVESGAIDTGTGEEYPVTGVNRTGFIQIFPSTQYVLSGLESGTIRIYEYRKDKSYISNYTTNARTFAVRTNDVNYVRIQSGDTILPLTGVQAEIGTQSTTYSPYTKSNDLTISFGQTVYGGQVDVEKGELVVDRSYISDLSTLTWSKRATTTNKWQFYVALNTMKLINSANDYADMKCSIYKIINANEAYNGNNGIGISSGLNNNYATLFVYDDTISELTDFQNAMDGVQLVYELATPITINLTPHAIKLLEGVNNISTDGDKITLTYRDGSVATLGDLTSAVDSLDSKIDESKILTDTATGDKYILVVTNGVLSVEQVSD